MKYNVGSKTILIEIDRTTLVDISPGDQLEFEAVKADYTWTEQDAQFAESNPDALLFVRLQKASGAFKGVGITVLPEELYK